MKGWYVAKSKPQKERWLTSSLSSLGVEVYCPQIVGRRRGRSVTEPLFPTYLFCRFDPDTSDWPSIRWAQGLSYFLGVDGGPCRIPDDLVDYIRRRVEMWNEDEDSAQRLNAGDRIKIANGPFSGLEGIFQHYVSSRQRCLILVNVVSRFTAVEIPEGDLAMGLARL